MIPDNFIELEKKKDFKITTHNLKVTVQQFNTLKQKFKELKFWIQVNSLNFDLSLNLPFTRTF